jgi:hypothetical protein
MVMCLQITKRFRIGGIFSVIECIRVSVVKHRDIPTAQALVPECSPLEGEIAIANFKRYKSPGIDQIPVELIQADCESVGFEIHKLRLQESL